MAETRDRSEQAQPRGIAAAAIEGAKEGERSAAANVNPDDAPAKLARPAPGMSKQPAAAPSTNQYTGVTGAKTEDAPERANPDADEESRSRAD